jgi:hypothetical protein
MNDMIFDEEEFVDLATRAKQIMNEYGRCKNVLYAHETGRVCAMGAVNRVFWGDHHEIVDNNFGYYPRYYIEGTVSHAFVIALGAELPDVHREGIPEKCGPSPKERRIGEGYCCNRAFESIKSVEDFNDWHETTDADIFALFDRVIEKYSPTATTQSQAELAAGPGE